MAALRRIQLRDVKRFAELSLPLRQLTILTGLNGSGKSTVVQSLLLAHHASLKGTTVVSLGAEPGLDLGTAADVFRHGAVHDEAEVVVEGESSTDVWRFGLGADADAQVPYLHVLERPKEPPPPIGLTGSSFSFLSAERLGPRTSHQASPTRPQDSTVGEDGRYCANALAVMEMDRHEVRTELRHPGSSHISSLRTHVEAWMSTVVGPIELEANLIPRTSVATLLVRTSRAAEWMLPTNVGFGVSYCLPVVLAPLLMPTGGLLIVDSPEAHLHPSAQSALAAFLARVAASGVQVILETHSDHIINGIRRAVGVDEVLAAADVAISFFGRDSEPVDVRLEARGSLSRWPDGFFDQMDDDLAALARAQRASPR